MANTKLKLKKSSVAGRVPVAGDLEYGELAINYRDGRLYYKDNANAIQSFMDSANAVTLIQNYSIDSSEATTLVTNLVDSDYISFRYGIVGDANTIVLNEYTGDSSTAAFALTHSPAEDQHAIVMVDGVVQQVNNYSVSGSQLTLDEAPITGAEIEVRTLRLQAGRVTVRDYANYIYQPSSATTVFTGADVNSQTLAYDVSKLDVYKNGVRLVPGLDYTAANGTSVSLLGGAADSGDTINISSFAAATINSSNNTTVLTGNGSNQIVDTFNKTVSRTAKYVVQMTQNSRYHSQEVMLIHDGTTVSMVEYADIYTESDLGTVDASISGDLVRIQVSPIYTNTTVKTHRIEVGV